MNKDLILEVMVHSFKKANINLAISSGVEKDSAEKQIESMDSVIKTCMGNVLEDLEKTFPDFIK